jgi:hypothetical protein
MIHFQITWRGIMSKILCTPYSRKEPWEFRATRYNVRMDRCLSLFCFNQKIEIRARSL